MTTAIEARDPLSSDLAKHSEQALLVKILAELRVQTLILAQGFNISDDISALRDDVMAGGNKTLTDI